MINKRIIHIIFFLFAFIFVLFTFPGVVKNVEAQTITVTSPAGGEKWVTGTVKTIEWTSTGLTGDVVIQYAKTSCGERTWFDIANPTANDGSFDWTVTGDLGSAYTVKVLSSADPDIFDESGEFHVLAVPPEDIDFGFPINEQEGGAGLIGETVRITRGNTIESRSDLYFPSPFGNGFEFEVTYNSRSSDVGPMGAGWTHSFGAKIDPAFVLDGLTCLKLTDPTGRNLYFFEQETGVFVSLYDEKSSLTVESGEYVWQRLDGFKFGFLSTGELTWIDDEKGNRINITYNAQNEVQTVTDTAGSRVLTFAYHATSGFLETITGPTTTAVPTGIWVTYGYDANSNLTSVTYADGSGFDYTYIDPNDIHNLTEKRNKANHLLNSWDYDSSDRVFDYFDVKGQSFEINYVNSITVQVTDDYNTSRTYTLDSVDGHVRVVSIQGIGNMPYIKSNAIRWEYDDDLNLIEVEYAGGTVNQYQDYDERGNPEKAIYASGTADEVVYQRSYHPVTNALLFNITPTVLTGWWKIMIWDYDDDGNSTYNENPTNMLHRFIEWGYTKNAAGAIISYEYVTAFTRNAKGQVLSIDGPLAGTGDTTSFSYAPATGNLLSITQPIIGTTGYSAYDNAGRVGTITDVNSRSKSFTYDGRGRILTITNDFDSSTTTYVYNTAGFLQSVTDPDNVITTYEYETTNGRLDKIIDAELNYIFHGYDSQGNLIDKSYYTALGLRTKHRRWSYQQPTYPGLLWKEINANNSEVVYTYEPSGNIDTIIDAESNITSYDYDALNRLTSMVQPGTITTSYTYDKHGNLKTVTDPENVVTSYVNDDMGRVIETSSPDIGTVTFLYDAANNLKQKTDARGITIQYGYDLLNRLETMTFPDTTQNITFSYDAGTDGMGRRTGMVDPSGTTGYGYDERGRLDEINYNINTQTYTVNRTFTPGSRQDLIMLPSGRTLTYSRNATTGKIDTVATTYSSTTRTIFSNMYYSPFSGLSGMDTGSGTEIDNVAGECGCIESINPGEQMEQIYTYDNNRNLTDISSTNVSRLSRTYGYDDINRLENATGPYGTAVYTYDDIGNRLTKNIDGDIDTYAYYSGTNRLQTITGVNPASYSYDANGNITGIDSKTLIYNQNNRLIRVEDGSTILGEYTYNGEGQRIIKTTADGTTIFIYDFDGNIITESLPDGTLQNEYLYMNGTRIVRVRISDEALFFYGNDLLGTPIIITDDTSKAVWEAEYKPFGEAIIHPESTLSSHFRFPGQYYDNETGFHYNWNRYYDPSTGRYLTPDPIGLEGGINRYAYVGGNVVNEKDPEGLNPVIGSVIGGITGGPFGAAAGAIAGSIIGALIGQSIWEIYIENVLLNENTEEGEGCDDSLDDYPANPDDWNPPAGWEETSAGEKTGGKHRHWKGPKGEFRKWDRGGRESGKERGPHWHDSKFPGRHISPNR